MSEENNQKSTKKTKSAIKSEKIEQDTVSDTPDFEPQKIKIEFPFSDILRAQAPKVFATVEDVATNVTHQWKNDERFENIGLPHPLAEMAATQILDKAKKVEKKLVEKGVFSLAKMGLAIAKAQADQLKDKLKK